MPFTWVLNNCKDEWEACVWSFMSNNSTTFHNKYINFKILNSRNNGYIYGTCNIIKHVFIFGLH
jgi:hypothetical protein